MDLFMISKPCLYSKTFATQFAFKRFFLSMSYLMILQDISIFKAFKTNVALKRIRWSSLLLLGHLPLLLRDIRRFQRRRGYQPLRRRSLFLFFLQTAALINLTVRTPIRIWHLVVTEAASLRSHSIKSG